MTPVRLVTVGGAATLVALLIVRGAAHTPEPAPALEASRPAPTTTVAQPAAANTPVQPQPRVAVPLRTVLDEHFADNRHRWSDQPDGVAQVIDGSYRLSVPPPDGFVAVGAPTDTTFREVLVKGTFRKTGGPRGGSYGLLVRDQTPAQQDDSGPAGRFYAFEVSDEGKIGAWRRDGGQWVELVSWTPSDLVRADDGVNELTVQASQERLTFQVNGVPVISQADPLFHEGGVGIVVAGDGNQVNVQQFLVQAPE